MNLRTELTSCQLCGDKSYPDTPFAPYTCYTCQWKLTEQDEAKQLAKPALCYECLVPINTHNNDLLCKICHLKYRVHEVYPGVFISDCFAAGEYEYLKSLGIKQILTIAKELKRHIHPDFVSTYIGIDDSPNENIKQYFDHAHEFISRAPTLVHCFAGISRSAAIVISYIMKMKKINAGDAIVHCRKIRPIINPNHGFIVQLIDYAGELGLHKVSTKKLADELTSEMFTLDEDLDWSTRSTVFSPQHTSPVVPEDKPTDETPDETVDKTAELLDTYVHIKQE